MNACFLIGVTLASIATAHGSVSEEQVVAHVTAVLRDYARSPETAPRELDVVKKLIVLDPKRVRSLQEHISWTCFRRHALTPDEQRLALSAWTGLLEQVLQAKVNGASLIEASQARDIALSSTLAIERRPGLSELTEEDFEKALRQYLAKPDSGSVAKLRRLRGGLAISLGPNRNQGRFGGGDRLSYFDGRLTWQIPLRNAPNPRGDPNRVIKAYERQFAPYRGDAKTVLIRALSAISLPDLGAPLLERDQLRLLQVDVQVMAPVAAAGMPGMGAVRPPASRGTSTRTIKSIRGPYPPRQVSLKEHLGMGFFPHRSSSNPELRLDVGGFQGSSINALAFSPDGSLLAAAGDIVRIWDVASGELRHVLRGERALGGAGDATDIAFSPDGRELLVSVSGLSPSLRVYHTADLPAIQATYTSHDGHIEQLAMSRDGKWLATANNFGLLQVWNWNEKRVMASYQFDVGIDHLSFPSKKPFLMALQSNGAYAFWDVTGRRGGTPQGLLTPALEKLGTDQAAHPFAVAADYDKRVCLLGGVTYENKRAKAYWCRLFGAETGPPPHKHNYFITACALSNDARRVASADALGNIDVWQADGDELLELRGQCRAVYSVGFGADWPAQPELTFGRNQYRYPTWDFNHYADRDKVFDLASRSIRDQVSQPPVKHLLASEDHELSFDPTTEERRLEVKVDNVLKSRIHFPARNQWRPLSYGLLRGDSLGLRDAVVTSMADGTIECFEPDRLMGRRTFLGHTDQVWSWDQARDQEFLLSGSSDGTMRLWKLQPPEAWGNLAAYIDQHGKVIHVIPRTPTSNAGIALGDLIQQIDGQSLSDLGQQFAAGAKWPFRPGQRVSVSLMRGTTTYQREVQLSNMGDVAQPLLSIFVSNDGREWIIWTPEGYFDASSGGAQLAGWHVNRGSDHAADFYPLDDFSEQFYRPDVIDMLLQTGNVEEALRLCSGDVQVPIAPIFIEQALPPQIRIIEPPPVTVTGSPTIEVLARILSDSAPERVSVKVNGKARYYRNVVIEPIVSDNQREYEYRLTVNLSPGENEIQVVAANAHALSQSTAILVDYRKEIAPKPKKRLLIGAVGISKYQHRDIDNLKYADDDAEDFARAWETQRGRGLFDEVLPPKVLKDENATEEGVREELLDWFRKTATQDDVVVLLVSGHGVLDKHTYYLVTHDADPNEISTTCVRWSDFAALAEDLDCPLVMFVDTCHAQAIVGVNGIRSDPFKMLARADLGVAVYAACQRRDKSREYDALEHGAFVHALLDILNTRAGDVDGVLKASELQTRLGEKVHELTDGDQTTPAYMLGDDLDLFAYPK